MGKSLVTIIVNARNLNCLCIYDDRNKYISCSMTKPTKWFVRSAKTQISLGIRHAQWVAKDPNFPHADSKDYDQTGRMPRLI